MCLSPDAPLVPARTTSPFLAREARLVALTRAVAPLDLDALADPFARAACYVAARLQPVADAEDEEARRRSEVYWRRIRRAPDAPVPVAAAAFATSDATSELADA